MCLIKYFSSILVTLKNTTRTDTIMISVIAITVAISS